LAQARPKAREISTDYSHHRIIGHFRTIAADSGDREEIDMSQNEEDNAKEFRGRFDPLLHKKIKRAAKDSFRSMSAEVSYRLQKSFEQSETAQAISAT
jgi:hypothetical protein